MGPSGIGTLYSMSTARSLFNLTFLFPLLQICYSERNHPVFCLPLSHFQKLEILLRRNLSLFEVPHGTWLLVFQGGAWEEIYIGHLLYALLLLCLNVKNFSPVLDTANGQIISLLQHLLPGYLNSMWSRINLYSALFTHTTHGTAKPNPKLIVV